MEVDKTTAQAENIVKWAESKRHLDFADLLSQTLEITKSLRGVPLSAKRRQMLAVKLLPGAALLNESQKARLAQVSDPAWWAANHDPRFLKVCHEFVCSETGRYLAELWQAHVRDALNGDKEIRRQILEAAGLLGPKIAEAPAPTTQHNGNIYVTQIYGKLADEEAAALDATVANILSRSSQRVRG